MPGSRDPRAFIIANLHLKPAPSVPEIRLYAAHPASRVSRLAGDSQPYWAYGWAGGTVLARYLLDHPDAVSGRRVVDIGCGSGIVAIAAAKAGAAEITAVDIDTNAIAATVLNAEANDVRLSAVRADILDDGPPEADIILVGDLFYDQATAARLAIYLDRSLAEGRAVLIGDPNRRYLPHDRLTLLAEYAVPDFGHTRESPLAKSAVYAFA